MFFIDNDPDIFAVTETFLDLTVDNAELEIDGYNLYRKDRNRHGGGVAIYIRSVIPHNLITMNNDIESLWLELTLKHRYAIGCLYRPPSSSKDYHDKIIHEIELITNKFTNMVLLGDFNYNCDVNNPNNALAQVAEIEDINACKQIVTTPTRCNLITQSIIDLIFTTNPADHTDTAVLHTGCSDHYIVQTSIKLLKPANHVIKQFRSYRNFDINNFNIELKHELNSIESLYDNNNTTKTDTLWDKFLNIFKGISDKHATLKIKRVKKTIKSWITPDIIKDIKERDKLKKVAIHMKCANTWNNYKHKRNYLVNKIKKAKKQHYAYMLNNSHNSKDTWRILSPLFKSGQAQRIDPSELNEFNNYFSKVGDNLAEVFKDNMFVNNLQHSIHTFKFSDVSVLEVYKLLIGLGELPNLDILDVDKKLLYFAAKTISPTLTRIINMSLATGEFPRILKIARITPIYKGKGDKMLPCNYRPVSCLPHLSKILERVVYNQLNNYVLQHAFISPYQFGFRKGHSTAWAMLKLVSDIVTSANETLLTSAVFYDLAKCFDSIDRSLIIDKLANYGLRDAELDWFHSYLTNRLQCVRSGHCTSDTQSINYGVPQGSNLAPLLFVLFINDLPNALVGSDMVQFADDITIYMSELTTSDMQPLLQKNICNIEKWFSNNKVTINYDKCLVMNFGTGQKLRNSTKVSYKLNNTILEEVNNCKLLGIFFDQSLTFDIHCSELSKKMMKRFFLFKRLREFIPFNTLLQLYNSLIQPLMDYGICIWAFGSSCHVNKIQKIQNKFARLILQNYNYNIHSITLVSELKWQTVLQRRDYFTALTMYQIIHGIAPSAMQNYFYINTHDLSTRHGNDLQTPLVNVEFLRKSFLYNGPNLWNRLPEALKSCPTLNIFKNYYKLL